MVNISDVYTSNIIIKLGVAIIIILLGIVFARFLSKLTKKVLHELELNRILKEQTKVKIPLEEAIASLVKYLIYVIAVVIALSHIGLSLTFLYIILIIVIVILVIIIILAIKDFIPNMVSGFFIHQRKLIKKGAYIQTKNIEGEVLEVSLIETKIKTKNKDIVYIPNSLLTKSEIVIKNGDNKKDKTFRKRKG